MVFYPSKRNSKTEIGAGSCSVAVTDLTVLGRIAEGAWNWNLGKPLSAQSSAGCSAGASNIWELIEMQSMETWSVKVQREA